MNLFFQMETTIVSNRESGRLQKTNANLQSSVIFYGGNLIMITET